MVIWSSPFVPVFFTWFEQVLRLAVLTFKDLVMFCSDSCCFSEEEPLEFTTCNLSNRLNDRLLNWLLNNNFLAGRLHENFGLNRGNHCGNWVDSIAKMVEDDFTELDAFLATGVHKFEFDAFGITVKLWECYCVPVPQTEVKLSERNFSPATLEHVELLDSDFSWLFPWMISRALKTNAFEMHAVGEFNLNP